MKLFTPVFLYSAFWGSLQTELSFQNDFKKLENEYEMKLNVKKPQSTIF